MWRNRSSDYQQALVAQPHRRVRASGSILCERHPWPSSRCFPDKGSLSRARCGLTESHPATAAVHASVRETCFYRFSFARSCSLRVAEEVTAGAQVPLAYRRPRTVRSDCQSRGPGRRYGSLVDICVLSYIAFECRSFRQVRSRLASSSL